MSNEKEQPSQKDAISAPLFVKSIKKLDRLLAGDRGIDTVVHYVTNEIGNIDKTQEYLIPARTINDMIGGSAGNSTFQSPRRESYAAITQMILNAADGDDRSKPMIDTGGIRVQADADIVKTHLEGLQRSVSACRDYYHQLSKGTAPDINEEKQQPLRDALETQGYPSLLDSIDAATTRALHALDNNIGLHQALFDKLGSRNESPKR